MKVTQTWRTHWWARSLLLLALALASCDQEPEPQWILFTPPNGQFQVMMPDEPIKKEPQSGSEFEANSWHIVSALSNISGLAVGYSDRPTTQNFQSDPKKVLDSVREKAVSDLRGQLLNERAIELNGHPGREFQAMIQGGFTVRQRIYLVNTRLYSLMVVAGSDGIFSAEAQRFFNSFKLLP